MKAFTDIQNTYHNTKTFFFVPMHRFLATLDAIDILYLVYLYINIIRIFRSAD